MWKTLDREMQKKGFTNAKMCYNSIVIKERMKEMKNKETKVSLKEMFAEYARKELEFVKNSDPEKVYHRILPNFKDKTKASINFLYKYIKVDGLIDGDTIYLVKVRATKWGKEEDIEKVIAKVSEIVNKGDMKLVNQI